jgi:translation initiation factor IF-2
VPIGELIKKFIANKMMLSLNSSIDFDTAALISEEFGVKVNKEKATIEMQDVLE